MNDSQAGLSYDIRYQRETGKDRKTTTATRTSEAEAEALSPTCSIFPGVAEREQLENFLTQELILANQRVAGGSVVPTQDFDVFKRELADFDFEAPRPLKQLLKWTMAQMEHGIVHVNNPRYFGLFNPAPTFPAQSADRIVASFNPQLATSTTSPAAVEIEAHVIREVAKRAGLPASSGGHFTSSGSEANYTALICALTKLNPGFGSEGARAFKGAPVFYVSRECHLGWLKIAHQAGIGRSGVRLIATDGSGRMHATDLAEALRSDQAAGRVPVMIVATAGTTNAGMVDPLFACAQLARAHRLWYHVDAAWGGALIASDRLRHALEGIEQADSVTIDAHKWFATTMNCGMFLAREPSVLSSAFQVSTTFMPSNLVHIDPYVTTVQWSRRFLGLRLFLSLAAAGWAGYGHHVERSIALAELLKTELTKRGWKVVNSSPLALLCFTAPPGCAELRTIARRVLASGRAWIAPAVFERNDVLRACVTHGETTREDVMQLVQALTACAR